MPLDMIRASAVDLALALKRQAESNRWDCVSPRLLIYRGEAPVATTVFRELDEGTLLRGFALAAWGFDADALALIFEGWSTELTLNPATDEPWVPEDFELFDAASKGWATRAIVVVCVNRAGDIRMAEMPYLNDREVRWGATSYNDVDIHSRWARTMLRAMNAPSGSVMLPGVTDEFTRAQRDVWTADHLQATTGARVQLVSTSRPNMTYPREASVTWTEN